MENTCHADILAGKSHTLELFHPVYFLPGWTAAVFLAARYFFQGLDVWLFAVVGGAAVILTAAAFGIAARRRGLEGWRLEQGVFRCRRGTVIREMLACRTDRLTCVELTDVAWYGVFGGVRVRLYSDASKRPFFSMILPRRDAESLLARMAADHDPGGRTRRRHVVSGKYAGLLGAVTARDVSLPLFGAGLMGLLGAGRTEMMLMAAFLGLIGLAALLVRLISEYGMSVDRVAGGYMIRMGLLVERRIFVPMNGVAGVLERRSPLGALCGASRLELVCRGGKRLPCMRWYAGGHSRHAALQLLEGSEAVCTCSSDGNAVKRRYYAEGLLFLFGTVLWTAVYFDGEHTGQMPVTALLLLAAAVQCGMGILCGSRFGVEILPGAVRISGMGHWCAECLTLRRGQLSEVRVSRSVWEQVKGQCTAEIFPKGCRRGVKCRCVPFDKMAAILDRFY